MSCQSCGIDAPTKYVEFYQNVGLLFARQQAETKGNLCRRCIGKCFKSYTLTTLFLGWWGVISFCVTPFILLNNVIRYLLALRLPEPGIGAMNTMSASIDSTPPSVGSGSFKLKLVYGTIVCAVILYLVASQVVGFWKSTRRPLTPHCIRAKSQVKRMQNTPEPQSGKISRP